MIEDKYCEICGAPAETHHIILRSECKPLENCKMNMINLCYYHHRDHKVGAHHNKKFNLKLKLEFQNKLELLFDSEYLTKSDIKNCLQISERATDSLCKTILSDKGKFYRQDVIRACMGGKMILDEEVK